MERPYLARGTSSFIENHLNESTSLSFFLSRGSSSCRRFDRVRETRCEPNNKNTTRSSVAVHSVELRVRVSIPIDTKVEERLEGRVYCVPHRGMRTRSVN